MDGASLESIEAQAMLGSISEAASLSLTERLIGSYVEVRVKALEKSATGHLYIFSGRVAHASEHLIHLTGCSDPHDPKSWDNLIFSPQLPGLTMQVAPIEFSSEGPPDGRSPAEWMIGRGIDVIVHGIKSGEGLSHGFRGMVSQATDHLIRITDVTGGEAAQNFDSRKDLVFSPQMAGLIIRVR